MKDQKIVINGDSINWERDRIDVDGRIYVHRVKAGIKDMPLWFYVEVEGGDVIIRYGDSLFYPPEYKTWGFYGDKSYILFHNGNLNVFRKGFWFFYDARKNDELWLTFCNWEGGLCETWKFNCGYNRIFHEGGYFIAYALDGIAYQREEFIVQFYEKFGVEFLDILALIDSGEVSRVDSNI